MKFVLLGCGTSSGVPMPACRCAVCTSTHPRNKRTRTAAALTGDDGRVVLIDTGIDLRSQVLTHDVRRVDAVVYTHAHADHILGLDELRAFYFVNRTTVTCHGTRTTLDGVIDTFPYLFGRHRKRPYEGAVLPSFPVREISPLEPFEAAGVPLLPFPLLHGTVPVTGYRVGDLVYATDCNALGEGAREAMSSATHLLIDALRPETHPTHFSIDEAVALGRELGAENTWLLHTSHNVDYETVGRSLPEGVRLAYDGLTLDVSADRTASSLSTSRPTR